MDKREDTLREALIKNSEEIERWNNYKNENEVAIENLDRFNKHLSVDVMVPLGRKAYMPGQLIHTNEVLVGHYQEYFSKCSSHKAKEICRHRIDCATDQLKKLETEANLWLDKLEKPYKEGVFPDPECREIIENYDEEQEVLWRKEHRVRVKQAKVREKSERENILVADKKDELNDDDILKKLEEAELMEELEKELENLKEEQVNDETIRKLMSGEMKLASKPRVSHAQTDNSEVSLKPVAKTDTESIHGIVKKADIKVMSSLTPATNNNNRPNPELQLTMSVRRIGGDSETEVEDTPHEVQVIKEQAKFLASIDQVAFYECQIKIIRQRLLKLPLKNQEDIDQKVHLLNVLENLEELMEIAEDTSVAEELSRENYDILDCDDESMPQKEQTNEDSTKQKRRISFALENDTLEFRKHETVLDMLPRAKRDVITFDNPVSKLSEMDTSSLKATHDRKKSILDKVEQSLQYMSEHQSEKDFDLVNKILGTCSEGCNTLQISFVHSNQCGSEASNFQVDGVPDSPANLYNIYLQNLENNKPKQPEILFTNSYEGESEVNVPILKEADREKSYEDPRLEYTKMVAPHKVEKKESNFGDNTKSILRNKAAVEKEHILKNGNTNEKKSKKKKANEGVADHEAYMSAYYKVMNEVTEKPLTASEPLPEGKFIDAHAPKKRVSRFKQSRSTTEKI